MFVILFTYISILYVRELYGYELTAWNLQKKYMNIVLISSLFNLISNLIFIPRFGMNAAAVNTILSEVINLFFMYRVSRKALLVRYDYNKYFTIIFSGVLMCAAIVMAKIFFENAFILVFIGSLVYILFIFLSKSITIEELKYMLSK